MRTSIEIPLNILSMLAATFLWLYGAWKGYTASEWGIIGQITLVYVLLEQQIRETKP